MKNNITFDVRLTVDTESIQSLLVSAFEGGSNYWYKIEKQKAPQYYEVRTDKKKIFPHVDYPMNPGGFLLITAHGDDEREMINGKSEWKLDRRAIENGLQTMARKHMRHFADAFSSNGDADQITGDIFLQCCLFGEVIYG